MLPKCVREIYLLNSLTTLLMCLLRYPLLIAKKVKLITEMSQVYNLVLSFSFSDSKPKYTEKEPRLVMRFEFPKNNMLAPCLLKKLMVKWPLFEWKYPLLKNTSQLEIWYALRRAIPMTNPAWMSCFCIRCFWRRIVFRRARLSLTLDHSQFSNLLSRAWMLKLIFLSHLRFYLLPWILLSMMSCTIYRIRLSLFFTCFVRLNFP